MWQPGRSLFGNWRCSIGYRVSIGIPDQDVSAAPSSIVFTRLSRRRARDRVIPFDQGERLFEAAGSKDKEFVRFRNRDHNDPLSQGFHEAFDAFLNRLPPESTDPSPPTERR